MSIRSLNDLLQACSSALRGQPAEESVIVGYTSDDLPVFAHVVQRSEPVAVVIDLAAARQRFCTKYGVRYRPPAEGAVATVTYLPLG